MTTSDGIRIDADSVEHLLENDLEALVEFAPDNPLYLTSNDVVCRAIDTANSEVDELLGAGPDATLAGFAMELRLVPSMESVTAWLAVFAREVAAEGMSGVLHAMPLDRLPQWYTRLREVRVTAFARFDEAFTGRADLQGRGRCVDTSELRVIDRFRRAATCISDFDGDVYVGNSGLNQLAVGGDVAWYLYRALSQAFIANVEVLDRAARRAASASFARDGETVFQLYDSSATLTAQADRIRDVLLSNAQGMRLAFATVTSQRVHSWEARAGLLPELPTIESRHLRGDAPLWGHFVPDVHGMQLLTREHLDRATDISAWTVTEASAGRYLVEAPDLSEWFKADGPDDAILARARADFGEMIVPVGVLE